MSADALREQIRAKIQAKWRANAPSQPTAPSSNTPAQDKLDPAVVIPLRLGRSDDADTLAQLFQRLAASPALLNMADAGLLRFDLRTDASALSCVSAPVAAPFKPQPSTSAMAATTAIDPAACCSSCKEGKACECKGDTCDMHDHPEDVPELQGVIGEKLLKTLPLSVKTVRIHPKAVLTPLGKEALRKRGITIDRGTAP